MKNDFVITLARQYGCGGRTVGKLVADKLGYGWKYCDPITVPEAEMNRFIFAVGATDSPVYYLPEEITSKMFGHRIRIVGGVLDGYEGKLITTRGSRVKRLLVELPHLIAAGIEVAPEYIQVVE